MAKYLKLFETHSQYEAYIGGGGAVLPNVSYCIDNDEVHYNPWVAPRLIAAYTVTDDTNPTQLYTYVSEGGMTIDGAAMFDKVEIDGTEVSIADLDTAQGAYQLAAGVHTVKYTLKDPTIIGLFMDESTGTMTVGATFAMMCPALTSVTIPNSVTTIGEMAFNGCTSLTSVTIPNSVTSIGGSAFNGCTSLTSVTIPNGVTSIGNSAFYGCTSLTSVTIGNGVTSIFADAFNTCTSLTNITIPNSVTSIGSGAFNGCTSLTTVTIGNSVTEIGDNAFCDCTSLTSITIPNSVTIIGYWAFENCTSLTSVTIPNSVTTIGNYVFNGCTSLTSVTIEAILPPTGGTGMFATQNNCPIYVPAQSVDTYKAASGWSEYADRIFAIQS